MWVSEASVGDSLVWWLGSVWIVQEANKVFEKFTSAETLPAWTEWKERQDEVKQGYETSDSPQARNRLIDLPSSKHMSFFKKREEQPWRQFRGQWPEVTSPRRWGHLLQGSTRRGSSSVSEGGTNSSVPKGRAPIAQGHHQSPVSPEDQALSQRGLFPCLQF